MQSGNTERGPSRRRIGRRWPRRVQSYGSALRLPEGCACALCWSPRRGLGAKTRLSRLVLNFPPSAPADSPLALLGSLRRQAWGSRRCSRAVCAHRPGARSLPSAFLPPPPPPPVSSSSSRHLLTLPGWEQPPAPAPRRRWTLLRAGPAAPPGSTARPSPWSREGGGGLEEAGCSRGRRGC